MKRVIQDHKNVEIKDVETNCLEMQMRDKRRCAVVSVWRTRELQPLSSSWSIHLLDRLFADSWYAQRSEKRWCKSVLILTLCAESLEQSVSRDGQVR